MICVCVCVRMLYENNYILMLFIFLLNYRFRLNEQWVHLNKKIHVYESIWIHLFVKYLAILSIQNKAAADRLQCIRRIQFAQIQKKKHADSVFNHNTYSEHYTEYNEQGGKVVIFFVEIDTKPSFSIFTENHNLSS